MEYEDKNQNLREILVGVNDTWQKRLMRRIENSHKRPCDVYKKAHISKQTFSKIKNEKNRTLDKSTALALAIGLELSLNEAVEFLSETGHAFSKIDAVDMVVQDFILKKEYDITKINIELASLNLSLLGEERNSKKVPCS